MSLWIIARRELTEHRLAWAAAALTGLMGVLVPWVKGLSGLPLQDGIMILSLSFAYAFALAVILGATMFPNDLANGRLGFYLSRPVSLGAILGGRFLGAWLLAAGGAILTGLPLVLLHRHLALLWLQIGALNAVVTVPILLAAHFAGIAVRARSRWILLDLATLALGCLALNWQLERLSELGPQAWHALPWLLAGGLAWGCLTLLAACWLQLSLGRAELARGHRILSLTLALGLGAGLLGGATFIQCFKARTAHPKVASKAPDHGPTFRRTYPSAIR